MAVELTGSHPSAHGLTQLVGQHEGRLVLAVQVAAELKGRNALGAVHEDCNRGQQVADRQLAAGEDRGRGDRELRFAALALVDRPGMVRVDRHAAVARAKRLAGVP